ncbi:unnamed protein product [Echinostoma caproni]|uniref:Uncharacterized protein n=1 Tax=Echinostoma caproni TaxID=27848 RepID=A0A3P8LCG0_9TREM|nr:unnamed protein product [Echinostoma caproni]
MDAVQKDEKLEISWKIPEGSVDDYKYVVNQIEQGQDGQTTVTKEVETNGPISQKEGKVTQAVHECGLYEVLLKQKGDVKAKKTVQIGLTINLTAKLDADKIKIGWSIPSEDFILYNYTIHEVPSETIRDGSAFMETNPVEQSKMEYLERTVPKCGRYQIGLTKGKNNSVSTETSEGMYAHDQYMWLLPF